MIKTVLRLILTLCILCLNTKGSIVLGSPTIVEEYSESKGFLPVSMTGLNPLDRIFYLSCDLAMAFNYIESNREIKWNNFNNNIKNKNSNTNSKIKIF